MSDVEPSAAGGGASNGLAPLIDRGRRIAGAATRWLGPVALLALRLPVAVVFWRSGRTKVEGWNIFSVNDSQYFLFREEFGLPLPELMAHVTALAEHILPILLVLGLLTRLGALGMLAMTMVIQLGVYPDAWFSAHMFWATILFAVAALGPGPISLDRLLFRR
ncbi:MAG: DoxX family protein [Alphaproteobacteria bacterium]|nr:DoxX family protein [Alphaproteobacteria bacterium]